MHAIRAHREKIAVIGVVSLFFTIVAFHWFSAHVRQNLEENNKAIIQLEQMRIELVESLHQTEKSPRQQNKKVDFSSVKSFKTIKHTKALHITPHVRNLKLVILTFGSREFSSSLDVLNNNNDVIYWHEPMKVWERLDRNWRGNDLNVYVGDPLEKFSFNDDKSSYKSASEFYNEVLSCKFTPKIIGFLSRAAKVCPHYLTLTKAIGKLLKCDPKSNACGEPSTATVASLNQLCKERRYNVVVRESEEITLPLKFFYNNLTKTITSSLKVLHLVRDPRAAFLEFANAGRIPKNAFMDDLWTKGGFACNKLTQNLGTGKTKMTSYSLFRYEDFSSDTDITQKLFNLTPTTTKSSNDGDDMLRLSWWRAEISSTFSSTVENICWTAIDELGYNFLEADVNEGHSFKRLKL